VAYVTGSRHGGVVQLRRKNLDLKRGLLRLNPGTTKGDEGRVFPLNAELRQVSQSFLGKSQIRTRDPRLVTTIGNYGVVTTLCLDNFRPWLDLGLLPAKRDETRQWMIFDPGSSMRPNRQFVSHQVLAPTHSTTYSHGGTKRVSVTPASSGQGGMSAESSPMIAWIAMVRIQHLQDQSRHEAWARVFPGRRPTAAIARNQRWLKLHVLPTSIVRSPATSSAKSHSSSSP